MTRAMVPIVLLLAACTERPPVLGTVDDLVARERAFAAMSVDSGIRPAFLAFLSDSAILFRPGPVPGRAWMASRPNPPGTLDWRPVRAMVAGGRDLGWTTGPYTYALDGDTSYGQFVSVWERGDMGRWEVLLDLGISHARASVPDEPLETTALPPARAAVSPAALRIDLLRRDRAILAAARADMRAAFDEAYAAGARLYRDGRAPLSVPPERLMALPPTPTTLTWEPSDARVSSAGDLGVTHGSLVSPGDDVWMLAQGRYRYVRIWQRVDGEFRVVVEIVVPE